MNKRQCKISKPLRSVDIKTRGHGGRSGTPNVRRKKEEDSAECGVHPVATLNEISAGLKPLRGRGSGKKQIQDCPLAAVRRFRLRQGDVMFALALG